MSDVRVIITYNDKDKLESITVDNEEMDIECASEFTVKELFQKHTGRVGWLGLVEEVKKYTDSDSIFAEFKGSDTLKEEFRNCCKEYGLNWSIDGISSEVLIEKNQKEATVQRILGDETKAFKFDRESADNGSSEMKRNIAELYYKASQGELPLNKTDAESTHQAFEHAIEYYGKAAGNNKDDLFELYKLLNKHDDEDQFFWLKKAADNGHIEAIKLLADYYSEFDTDEDDKKAFHYYELAAQNNDPDYLYILGLYYSLGIGTNESNEKAFDCYNKAANLGHVKSQCEVADCFCSGCGTEKDICKAIEMYRKAAENDNTYAQYKLGEIYYYGDEGYKDETIGLEWFELVAKKDWSLDDQEMIEEAAIVLGIECYENNDFSTAINWFLKASENDNSDAQYLLGRVYVDLGDYQNAVTWYLKAANAGHKVAQYETGNCYFQSIGVSEDYSMAAHWFEESNNNQSICRFDYPDGTDIQLLIGRCYFLLQSFDQSREWLTRSANQGNNIAVYYLGQIEKEEGNLTESFNLFTTATENGDADAQYELGNCYYYGSGTDIDYAKAVKWYTKAAKSGDADAQYQLGVCYENGLGVDKDEYVAFKWYEQAANSDHVDAQYQLGKCYENGVGVEKDDNVAFYWYEQAAKSGHTDAQCQLGDCYDSGIGVKVHYPTAAEWYTKAAENGNTDAQLKLGRYFALGYGVKRNYSKAIDYYKQAVDKGDITAQLMLGACYRLTNEYTESFKWYEKAAENGSQEAQYFIAECYYSGLGTEKDYLQTFQILNALVGVIDEKMVTYGNIFLLLGECYENGRGTEQNLGAAITSYKVIADRDYEETKEACYRIGKIYYDSFKMGRPIYSYTNTSTSTAANVARIITDVITPIPVTLISNYINKKNKMTEILKTKPGETMVSYFEKAAKLGHEDSKKIMKELNKYR